MIIFGITTILMKDIIQNIIEFSILLCLIIIIYIFSRIPLRIIFREMKYFYYVIPTVILISSFEFKATNTYFLNHFSVVGLLYSLTFCVKLLLFSLVSIVFIATTTIRQITFSIEWLLRPIPFISATDVATMISLTIVQVPVIFDIILEINHAQKSRCVENIKNPIRRLTIFLMPTLTKVIRNAENITFSFESRCYNNDRTKYEFRSTKKDWFYFSIFSLICVLTFLINWFLR
ncbi:MAG: energy-coupling factor transporter transmembrane protein EcfT [Bacteroidales bacterium]|nr:energy-coupling factor transporter transmembrane protein EcfT [Bacteroidales bacterium]